MERILFLNRIGLRAYVNLRYFGVAYRTFRT